ncbi:MAG: carboxypeptidase-like regulatory domain-containing protein [Stackebrandtia sp.]
MTTSATFSARPRWVFHAAAIGVACAAAFAGAVAVGAPAYGAPPPATVVDVKVDPADASLTAGEGTTSLTVTLTNSNPRDPVENVSASVETPGLEGTATATPAQGDCETVQANTVGCGKLERGAAKTFTVEVAAVDTAQEEPVSGQISISVLPPNSASGTSVSTANVTVQPGEQFGKGVEGVVNDEEGNPVEGVEVTVKDKENHTFDGATDAEGKYSVEGELAEGEATISFEKDGYKAIDDQTVDVKADDMAKAEDVELVAEEEAKDTTSDPGDGGEDKGLGLSTWLLIILGGLLVVGGIVAIVLLLRKGKNDDEDDDDVYRDAPLNHRPLATQTGQLGVYDAGPMRPGMNAETMIHNGPLVNDDDLARYGSAPHEPSTSSGFGPAYGDSRPTQRVDPMRDEPPPDNRSTRRYQSHEEPPSEGRSGGYRRDDWGGAPPHSGGTAPMPSQEPGYEPPRRRYRDDDYDDRPRSW